MRFELAKLLSGIALFCYKVETKKNASDMFLELEKEPRMKFAQQT